MVHYYFGDMLRQARKELNLTQEELAFGICSVGTISKIENGTCIPRRRNYEALLQRIGKSSYVQRIQLSQADAKQQNIIYEIKRCIADNDVEQAGRLLEQHFPKEGQQDALSIQFVQYMWAIIFYRRGVPPEEVMEELRQALSLTGLNTGESITLKRFYTFDEMIILNNIAIQHLRKKEYREAFLLWDGLKVYLDKRPVTAEEKVKIYPMIQYNCALMYAEIGMREQCCKMCREGISLCREQGQLFVLPYLMDCLAENSEGGEEHSADYRERVETLFGAMNFRKVRRMEPICLVC